MHRRIATSAYQHPNRHVNGHRRPWTLAVPTARALALVTVAPGWWDLWNLPRRREDISSFRMMRRRSQWIQILYHHSHHEYCQQCKSSLEAWALRRWKDGWITFVSGLVNWLICQVYNFRTWNDWFFHPWENILWLEYIIIAIFWCNIYQVQEV